MSVDPSTGTVALTGAFQGTASFGVGTLTSAGANDIFLLTLAPYGSDTRRRDRWAA